MVLSWFRAAAGLKKRVPSTRRRSPWKRLWFDALEDRITPSRIAYVSSNDIWIMNADGTGQMQLTSGADIDGFPSISPDGTQIVFDSNRAGKFDVFVMNIDGTGITNLSNHATADDRDPAWSPDGSKIVFWSDRQGNRDIFVMNANGTAQTQLTTNAAGDYEPTWSHDGAKIAFVSNRGTFQQIWQIDVSTKAEQQITTGLAHHTEPAWSPSGTKILFTRGEDVWIMDSGGGNELNLTNGLLSDDSMASWKPDGSQIAFASNRDGNYEIYTMGADGSNPTRRTTNSVTDVHPSWGSAAPQTTTSVAVSAGNLVITDTAGKNDTLTISLVNGNTLRVHDPANALAAGAGATKIDANTIHVSLASVTGLIQIDTAAGDDSVTFDFSGGIPLPAGGVTYAGGSNDAGGDKLHLSNVGSLFARHTYDYTNANDGAILLDPDGPGGQAAFSIGYTGLEPITNDGTATDLVFNLPGTADDAVLEDDGTPGNGVIRLRSTNLSFEQTSFAIPTGSITINLGAGNDTLAVNNLDGSAVSLTINGEADTDVISINTALQLGSASSAGNLSLSADTINLNHATIRTDLGPTSAGGVLLSGAVVLGANVTIDSDHASGGDGAINFSGAASTINSDVTARQLTLNTGSGGVTLAAAVGGTQPLSGLTVTGGAIDVSAITTGSGGIDITGTSVMLRGNLHADVQAAAGPVTITGPITLAGGSIRIDTDATTDADITLQAVNGAADLTLEAGVGQIFLNGEVGGTTPLASVTFNSLSATPLQLDEGVSVDLTSGVITINVAAGVNQVVGGFLSGDGLRLLGSGSFILDVQLNTVNKLAADLNSGSIRYIDGDDIFLDAVAGLSGIRTGDPGNGGSVTLTASGNGIIFVNNPINTGLGSGGRLTFNQGVTLNHTVTVGAGDVTLLGGGNLDLVISTPLSFAFPVTLRSIRDIIVDSTLETTGANSHLRLEADTQGDGASDDGVGGVHVTATGQLNAAGLLDLMGSDLFATALVVDSVVIDSPVLGTPVLATGTIQLASNLQAPADANIVVQGAVQSTGGNVFVTTANEILLGAALQASAGDINLGNGVVLVADVALTGVNVSFVSTVDDDGLAGTGSALLVNASGVTFFGDLVGAVNPLESITTDAAGSTEIAAESITTAGSTQTYYDPVVIANNVLLSDTGGGIIFHSTVDTDGTLFDLSIETFGTPAVVQFHDVVGGLAPLNQLSIDNSGLLTIAVGANIFLDDAFRQVGIGDSEIGGHITTTSAPIRFSGQVTLLSDIILDAGAGADVSFGEQVLSDGTARDLTIRAGVGAVTFSDAVGTAPAHLDQLLITAAQIEFQSTARANHVELNAADTAFRDDITALTDDVVVTGNLQIQGDVAVATGGGPLDDFSVSGNIAADVEDNDRTLRIAAGAGRVLLASTVGSVPLLSFTITSAARAELSGIVTRHGGIDVTASDIVLSGSLSTDANSSSGNAGAIMLTGAVQLAETIMLAADGVAADGNIDINGPIDADDVNNLRGLAIYADSGQVRLGGAIGAVEPLLGLLVSAAALAVDGGAITTLDAQIFSTVATLGADTTLTAGGVSSSVAIDNNSFDLTIDTAGTWNAAGSITGAGGLIKNGVGTLTLAAASDYVGLTTVNAGTLFVTGSIAADVTVLGGLLGGVGAIAGAVTIGSTGQLAPGLSPGVLSTGPLTLNNGAQFNVEIGGPTPGAGAGFHDQIDVAGAVTISTSAVLNLSVVGLYVPQPGDFYNLINNDLDDEVSGYFFGLPEGAVLDNDFLGSGLPAYITYMGGDGNDVGIAVAGPLVCNLLGSGTLRVRLDPTGSNLQCVLDGVVIDSRPLVAVSQLTINGSTGSDTAIIDFSNGDPVPVQGINFIAGEGPNDHDTIVVENFNVGQVTVTHTGLEDGTIQVGAGSPLITFSETEPLVLAGTMEDLVINLPAGPNTDVLLHDDGAADDPDGVEDAGFSALSGSTFEFTQFSNPSKSLTINLSDDGDSIRLADLDAGFAATFGIEIVGGGAADSLTIDFGSGNNVIPAGDLTFVGNGGNNAVELRSGYTATNIDHTFADSASGEISVDGRLFIYSDVPAASGIIDRVDAGDRSFTYLEIDNQITLGDDSDAGNGLSRLQSDHGTTVTFRDPALSITVVMGDGNDQLTFRDLDDQDPTEPLLFFQGGLGNDSLTIDHAGRFAAQVVDFDGGADSDSVLITGNPGFTAALETYLVGATQDSGSWIIDPDASMGSGAVGPATGDEMILTFAGLEPIDSDVPATVFDVILTTGADYLTIQDAVLNSVAALEVVDENNTFESFRFANKQTVQLMGNSGADAFRLDYSVNAVGLTTLELFGHIAPGVAGQPADDDSSDIVQLYRSAAPILNIFGQGGSDIVNNTDFASNPLPSAAGDFDLSGISGTVTIFGGESSGDYDLVNLQDSDRTGPVTATLSAGQFTVTGSATFNYTDIEAWLYEGSAGNDEIDVLSTAAGTSYFLTGNGGDDIVTVGGQSASLVLQANGTYASAGGSLDAIAGDVTISGAFANDPGATDVINVDDSATASFEAAAGVIARSAGFSFSRGALAGDLSGAVTTLTGFAPAPIRFFHGATDFSASNRIDSLNIVGSAGADVVTVDHSGGFVAQVFTYNGHAGFNSLVITGDPSLPVTARETYLVGDTQDAGRWIIDPNDSMGAGATGAVDGDEMQITFAGLAPVDSDTPVMHFDAVLSSAADTAVVEDGGLFQGAAALQVTDLGNTFETFRFANKTNVRLSGNESADEVRLNYTTAAAGLRNFEIYGHAASGLLGLNADDDATDTVVVQRNADNVAHFVWGQGGDDVLRHLTADGGNLNRWLGSITFDGGAGSDTIALQDHGDLDADAVTLTSTTLTGAAPGPLVYSNAEYFFLEATAAGDTIDILSTQLGTVYLISGGGGSDTITIGNQTAQFGTVFDGSLAAIQGAITVAPEFNGAAGVDTLNIDASGDAALAGTATISTIGDTTVNGLVGPVFTGPTTRLSGFAAADIDYYHSDLSSPLGAATNRLEQLHILTSTGPDQISVLATTAVLTTTLDAREDDDFIEIAADKLAAGASHIFRGSTGNDTFDLNFSDGGLIPNSTSLQIVGDAPAFSASERDIVTLNLTLDTLVARSVTFSYVATGSGDLDISGLGGAGMGIDINGVESVAYQSDAANDDSATIVDTSAAVSPASVTPTAIGASYTRNGGVSGSEPGPDLTIAGLGGVANPLLLDGHDPNVTPGDQLVYNGPSPATKTLTGPGSGFITATGVIGIAYVRFEQISHATDDSFDDVVNVADLAGGADGSANRITLRRDASGAFLQILFDPDGPGTTPETILSTQLYASVRSVTVHGSNDDDTQVVDHGNDFVGKPIAFHGNAGFDVLVITGTPTVVDLSAARETFLVGASADAGVWIIDPDDSDGPGAPGTNRNGDEMVITFTGLEPVDSDTPVSIFDMILTGVADDVTVQNGGTLNGSAALQIVDGANAFEDVRFANKTLARIMGNSGADVFSLTATTAAAGLATLEIFGHVAADVGQPVDDDASDTFYVRATVAGADTTIFAGGGADTVNVGSSNASLDDLFGPLAILGEGDADELNIHDQGESDANEYTIADLQLPASPTRGQVSRSSGGVVIVHDGVETLSLYAGANADVFNVHSTVAGTVYTVWAGDGIDQFSVGDTGDSLDGIQGAITLHGQAHTGAGQSQYAVTCHTDTVSVQLDDGDSLVFRDQGDTDGNTYDLSATALQRSGAATVTYAAIERLTLHTGLGADDIQITSTADATATFVHFTDGQDNADVRATGNASYVELNGSDDANTISIHDSGPGSVIAVFGAAGVDTLRVHDSGAGSGIALHGEAGADLIGLGGAGTGSIISAHGGSERDTFSLGANGSLDNLLGRICIDGADHTLGTLESATVVCGPVSVTTTLEAGDRLYIDDQADADAHNYILAAATFQRDALTVHHAGIERFDLLAGQATDTIQIDALNSATLAFVSTTAGGDSVLVTNTGANTILEITGDSGANTITIQNTTGAGVVKVLAGGGNDTITLEASAADSNRGIQLDGGNDSDLITIRATGLGTITTALGGGNNDTINIGSVAFSLDGVLGRVCADGQGGSDTLNLRDDGDADGNDYTLTSNLFTRVAGNVTIEYAEIENLFVDAGNQADIVRVRSTHAGTSSTIRTSEGVDQILFGSTGNSLDGIVGPVLVNAGGHTGAASQAASVSCGGSTVTLSTVMGDQVVFNDSGDPNASTYTLDAGSFQRTGTAAVTYSAVERVHLQAGTGNDTINLLNTPAATRTRIQTTAGGDTLNITTTGASSVLDVVGDAAANTITLSSSGARSVTLLDGQGSADRFIISSTGANSGLAMNGSDGNDTFDIRGTGLGSLTEALGGNDNDTFNLGNPSASLDDILGQVCVDGQNGSADRIALNDSGETTGNTYLITSISVDRNGGLVELLYQGAERLELNSGAGGDTINVRSTSAPTPVIVNAGNGDDIFNVASDAPSNTGHLDDILGDLTVNAQGGAANRLFVTDLAGAANGNVVVTNNSISGLAPATIFYSAVGGQFTNTGGRDGIVIRGSAAGADTFLIASTLAGSSTQIEGHGGADAFHVGSSPTTNFGDLDLISGVLSIIAGAPGVSGNADCTRPAPNAEVPLPTDRDVLYLNDRADPNPNNYDINRTQANAVTSSPDTPRAFAGVFFDATLEYLRLDGTDLGNVFDVRPSLATQFYIDGNLPPPGVCAPGGVDYLRLDTTGTTGRRLHIEETGKGHWSFTSGHLHVCFESIERFNHVDKIAVANDRGAPIVRVYDAETLEFQFEVQPYEDFFRGGVRVAVADMNCDGIPDLITAPGAGRDPTVRIYDGAPDHAGEFAAASLGSFDAFSITMKKGVFVAAGDVTGDGANDVIVGADAGWLPQVRVYDGASGLASPTLVTTFNAYGSGFRGGVRVAAGDINNDRLAEIVTGSGNGASLVRVYNGGDFRRLKSFKPLGNQHKKGVFVAVGDFNGDGIRDIITASNGGWVPMVSVVHGADVLAPGAPQPYNSFLAFPNNVRTGVRLSVRPVEGGTSGAADKVNILMATGPDNGDHSRRVREAAFAGNNLKPAVVTRLFASAKFNGIFLG